MLPGRSLTPRTHPTIISSTMEQDRHLGRTTSLEGPVVELVASLQG